MPQAEKRGKDKAKPKAVILQLLGDEMLPPNLKDHPLRGDWVGYRDLHIERDRVLIYQITEVELQMARTGAHSDSFGE